MQSTADNDPDRRELQDTINPDIVREICIRDPELSMDRVREIISAFPAEKILRLPRRDLHRIIRAASDLKGSNPVSLIFDRSGGTAEAEGASVTIIGYDHPQLFIILTGILAANRLDIREGTVITSREIQGRRLIIDHFSGWLPRGSGSRDWGLHISTLLKEFYQLLESSGTDGREGIQQRIIELVSASLGSTSLPPSSLLKPIHIGISQRSDATVIQIKSSDTPFFLYSLSTALNLHELRIEHVQIETINGRLVDTIECTDQNGRPISNERVLNRIRLSVLISKQFTYFLDRAPDPAKALVRFDSLIQDVQQLDEADDYLRLLASPDFHGELARLLGTSDFIWEDFIRIQRDGILPMIRSVNQDRLLSRDPENTEPALKAAIEGAGKEFQDRIEALNAFKNRESFLIDMDHILVRNLDFFFLSRRLSALADAVIRQAAEISWEQMVARYGQPRSAAGMVAQWAVFGLGKLGGEALGYASDLELLYVFSDNGQTDGEEQISNRDFFERFFRQSSLAISAKKEGIFQVDLRLRPHGEDGPLAVKLDKFNEYFTSDGPAHSAERLALVRLRHIAGSRDLARQVLALRDHIVYESDAIRIPEIRNLRLVQLKEKIGSRSRGINVKFSPGGLADLEYNVQIMQVIQGRNNPALRSPGIHEALEQLSLQGTIDQAEAGAMIQAYRFLRNLINGLRMLRGNAEDLFLPSSDEREFRHLARRIGYRKAGELNEADQLSIDWETHSARVRQFVERHLGREAIPGSRKLSIMDIVLNESLDPEGVSEFLLACGFLEQRKALVNLKKIASRDESGFQALAVLAWNRILAGPDPDMALNNWEQFTARLSDVPLHLRQLISQPRRMAILFMLFASSQFLADTLIQNPEFFLWATDPEVVTRPRTQIDMEQDLAREARESIDRNDWLNRLRLMRKREILRIGVRDIALGVKIEEIMGEISFLARACAEAALKEALRREQMLDRAGTGTQAPRGTLSDAGAQAPLKAPVEAGAPSLADSISILAFGKLGGWELNYSSDIDLLCIYDTHAALDRDEQLQQVTRVFREMVKDLHDFTREGQAYRVDMRLRPYGASGPLVSSLPSILEYYQRHAEPWEFQALIKLKPIAGNLVLGERLLEALKPMFMDLWQKKDPRAEIRKMRGKSMAHHLGGEGSPLDHEEFTPGADFDVKNDRGGIRDIEFYIQGMQMMHSPLHPGVLTGNSLRGLSLLERAGLIDRERAALLGTAYRFLRRIEHYLQLSRNQQQHRLPQGQEELDKLARCVQPDWSPERFYRYLHATLKDVHHIYSDFISS